MAKSKTVEPERTERDTVVLNELTRIHDKFGVLQPRTVWLENQDAESPLHNLFEWDDQKAGAAYRDQQARHIIRSVKVEAGQWDEAPAFVRVRFLDQQSAYVKTEVAVQVEALWVQVLNEARKSVESLQARLDSLLAFEVHGERKTKIKNINGMLAKVRENIDAILPEGGED